MKGHVLIILKSHPEEASFFEALRIVLSFAGMDLIPRVVFADDAVLALSPEATFLNERLRHYVRSVIETTNPEVVLESLSDRGFTFGHIERYWGVHGVKSADLTALILAADTLFAL